MKILCVGRNYAAHAVELGNKIPGDPVIFMKAENALLPGSQFHYPPFSKQLHYEAELVIKICKRGKNILEKDAEAFYDQMTVGLDFTARDIQSELKKKGLPWEIAKSFDGSAAVGKWLNIPTGLNMTDVDFSLRINKKVVQEGNTSYMLFPISRIVAYISTYFTLEKDDLIYTGTPPGVGECHAGDNLEGYLEGEKVFDVEIL